jgi:branched-chain amino acid transport system permease protein
MNTLAAYVTRPFKALRSDVLVLPGRIAVLLICLLLLLFPVISREPYILRILILAAIFAVFAASWDLLSGFTGQMNFGHALFFGVAVYTSAILNRNLEWPPWATIPLGTFAAVLAGLVVGIPCLRLRGTYLAFATLAFPLILLGVVIAMRDITGGERGITDGIDPLSASRVVSYYIVIPSMIILGFIMWKITDSKIGLIFHAIREDEVTVRASGINTTRYKLLAFCLSGLFAGLAGGLYAHFSKAASPSTLELLLSFQVIIWAVFGGIATIYGPIVSVLILYPFTEYVLIRYLGGLSDSGSPILRFLAELSDARLLVFACLVLVVLLFMPRGIVPWLRDRTEKVCPRCKLQNVAWRRTCRVCTAGLD